jgi:hypothetical protein
VPRQGREERDDLRFPRRLGVDFVGALIVDLKKTLKTPE